MSMMSEAKMDKTVFEIGTLDEQGNDLDYWKAQTPLERLKAVEFMRQVMYGYDPSTARLQRIFTISKI